MKIRRSASTTLTGLISLTIFYILLIGLILVLAREVLLDVPNAQNLPVPFIISLAVVFTLILVGVIAVNIVRLLRDKAVGKPGVNLKFRLVLFFFFMVVLSSVPQAFLSINFLNAAMNSWFGSQIGEALRGGLAIAIDRHSESIDNLEQFTGSPLFESLVADVGRSPRRTWDTVRMLNPDIDSIQIFDGDFNELYFGGRDQEETRIGEMQARESREGLVIKDSIGSRSFFRIQKEVESGEEVYHVFLSILLPQGFDESAGLLTDSIERVTQLEMLQSNFLMAVIIFYSFFSFPLLLIAILVSFLLSEEIIRPIRQLEEATRSVAEGDFSIRLLSRSRDDLSMLVSSFNRMVSELEHTRVKILQTEKVAAWQEIAQRLAHEIKNPLTPIKLSAQRILRKYQTDPENIGKVLEPSVSSIISQVEALNKLLSEFRHFSRLPEPYPVPVSVKELVREVASMYSDNAKEVEIHYGTIDPKITVEVDRDQMRQVFSNLFKNAIESMDDSGDIYIRTDLVKKGNTRYSRIQIQDTGSGIEEEHYGSVFNPYFTTKTHGTGLGLAVVERIIFDHKGQIWFETQKEVGTTFFIDIPTESSHEQDFDHRRRREHT